MNLDEGLVIPIDKPSGWSSFQAVNKVKAYIRNRFGVSKFKIGHAGTLDPLATGLLLVCVGKATKSIPQLQDGDKEYTGTIVFGATTPCIDLERPVDSYRPFEHIDREAVERAAALFCGCIEQVPPTFSAVKVEGQRAYEQARNNAAAVEVKPRKVQIMAFDITSFTPATVAMAQLPAIAEVPVDQPRTGLYKNPLGVLPQGLPAATFKVQCGKGTYIRSLARDMGAALGSGAVLASLRRERVGQYTVGQAVLPTNLDEFEGF